MRTNPPPHRWRSLPFRALHRLPKVPGLYAIRFSRWPFSWTLYIGRSSNIHQRWNSIGGRRHHRYWQASLVPFCQVAYFETRAYERLEGHYIQRYSPPWNGTAKPWWGEQDNPVLGKAGALGWWCARTDWLGAVKVVVGILALVWVVESVVGMVGS